MTSVACALEQSRVPGEEAQFINRPKADVGFGGYDYLAPDKSEIRLLVEVSGGGLCHCSLPPGQVSRAKYHQTVEELWYFISGLGDVWRDEGSGGSVTSVSAGQAVNIPRGVRFQFRNTGVEPLRFAIATIPRWPGQEAGEKEAVDTEGPWAPSA